MTREKVFDFDAYTETLIDTFTDSFSEYINRDHYDGHGALSEAVFDAADEYLAYDADTSDVLNILQGSENDPQEWEPFAEGKNDWEEVVQAMAFTVVRQDLYDALEDQGYLDEHWNVTDKLMALEA